MKPTETTTLGFSFHISGVPAVPVHIPGDGNGAYKTELVIERAPDRTVKLNWWHNRDPRRDPHSHPWPFESIILAGGYTETRFTRTLIGSESGYDHHEWVESTHTYGVGDVNVMPAGVYHTVDSVAPGTVTRMVCGALTSGPKDWGYLVDGKHVQAKAGSEFIGRLHALNPHMVTK